MSPTAKQAAANYAAILRREAYGVGPYERLRERYARGAIDLEAFETEVELLLRMTVRLTEMGEAVVASPAL